MSNALNIPSDIKAKVDEIMGRNRVYSGMTMTLGSEVAPETTAPAVDSSQFTQTVPNPDEFFTKADIEAAMEKARAQEKEKVYGRLNSLQEKLESLTKVEQDRIAAEEEARKQAEAEARKREEENLSAKELLARKEQEWQEKLASTQQTFEQRLELLQQEREQERALLEKEKEFASLQAYTQQRLAQEQDNIAPQFVDFINGSTQEEIDRSIEVAKAKSAEIAEAARAALQAARAQQPGARPTGYPPVGPMEVQGGSRQYSPEDIANMPMAEYAKLRNDLVRNASQGNRGLFG